MCFLYSHVPMHAQCMLIFDRISGLNCISALALSQGIWGIKNRQVTYLRCSSNLTVGWPAGPRHFHIDNNEVHDSALAPCQVQQGDGASRASVPVKLLPHKPRHISWPHTTLTSQTCLIQRGGGVGRQAGLKHTPTSFRWANNWRQHSPEKRTCISRARKHP